jgi:hypothetical protein
MGFFSRCKKVVTKMAEFLNLKTDPEAKKAKGLSDEQLIVQLSSTRRSLTSSIFGTVANIALGVVCPVFAVSAAINTVQTIATGINHHRIRKEIKERKRDPKFKAALESCDKPLKDISLGIGIKAATTVISVGLVGFEKTLDGFAQVVHHGMHQATAGAVTHPVQQTAFHAYGHHSGHTSVHQGTYHASHHHHSGDDTAQNDSSSQHRDLNSKTAKFKHDHPKWAAADEKVQHIVGFPGNTIEGVLTQHTQNHIDATTSWSKLKEMTPNAVNVSLEESLKVPGQAFVIGASGELIPSSLSAAEEVTQRIFEHQDEKRAKKYVRDSQDLKGRGNLTASEEANMASKQVILLTELRSKQEANSK